MPLNRSTLQSRALVSLVVLLAVAALSLPAFAQSSSIRITQAIDESNLVTLTRNTRPEANLANDRGVLPDGYNLEHILVFLQRSAEQEKELNALIDSLNDRNSPNFHHWLSADEFGKFGVAQEDIDTVAGWLESHGFRINKIYPSHMLIDISGSAGRVREAFHTEIHNLQVGGVSHLSNMTDPMIPAALAPVVKGPFSLNDFRPQPMYISAKDYTFAGCTGSTGPGKCYAMTPQDNQTIYNLNPLYAAGYSGQGQTIALVEDTDTYGTAGSNGASDWNTYRSTFGLSTAFPAGTYTQIHPGGCADPGTNGDDGEAAIDVEVASAVAPSAAIELISCPSASFTFGGVLALQNLINGSAPYPGVVSSSYGLCEALTGAGGNAGFYNTFQQAASEGISVFTSSGDGGPSGCGGDFGKEYDLASLGITGWGETPYNVSVGGTDFEDTYNAKFGGPAVSTYWNATNTAGGGSALSYVPEIPWNDSCASVLISNYLTGSFIPYGASPATCNNALYDTTTTYLSTGAGAGGASNCATGAAGTNQSSDLESAPGCQGYPKPSWQSGSSLAGGQAVYGQPSDGVRDIPDVAMFAANGVWGHYEIVCWSDPSQTSGGSTSCSGAPSTWAGFGGTSVASPTMAAIQALVNQKTAQSWGNPNPLYYQIGQNQYGTAGGTFNGSGCNSSTGNTAGCAFNDVTQGDIDLACEFNGTLSESQCYKPTGNNGVDSTDNVTAAAVINGGTGYTTAPSCAIAGPSNNNPYLAPTGAVLWAGGTQATCTAAVNAGSTTAVWTVKIGTSGTNLATGSAGAPVTVGGTTYTFVTALTAANQVLVVTSGSTSTQETDAAKNLEAAINANSTQCVTAPCFGTGTVANASATATESTSTVTITAKTAGYAGNFNVTWGTSFNTEAADLITITNTTPGQGPNYVSGITVTTAGSGYGPETPITLTGSGTGAVAVANTSISTAAQSYQPAYGAAPGWDMATGLGSPNATALTNTCSWYLPNGTYGMYRPANSSTLTSNSQTFNWCVIPSATAYWIDIGSTAGGNNYYSSGNLGLVYSASTSNLPTNGSTIYVTLYDLVNGSWVSNPYTYTAFNANAETAVLTTPTPSSMLSGSTVTFGWSAGTASPQEYWLDIGSSVGGNNYYSSGNLGNALSTTASGLPTNGSTVYATLYTLVSGSWVPNNYTYTAFNASSAAGVLTTPTPGSTLTSSNVTFDWTAGSPGPYSYWMDIGSTAGGNNYYSSGNLGNVQTTTVSGLPTDGSTIYVTLYTLISGNWVGNAYTYIALNATSGLAMITSPTNGATLSGNTVTFNWSSDPNASAYWVDVSNVAPGGNDLDSSGNLGLAQTETIYNLPANGSTIYVTLYSYVGGQWLSSASSYTSGP